MLPSGKLMEINGNGISTDTVGDKCSYNFFEINSMTKVAGATFPAFTPLVPPLVQAALTPTVADLALNATDAGAPTMIESSNSCHNVPMGL